MLFRSVLGEARLISSAINNCAKIGPRMNRKLRRPVLPCILENFRADDVGWHEVGCELDALGIEAQNASERIDEQRLGEAWDTDEEPVPSGQDGDERLLDDQILSEDDGGCGFVNALYAFAGSLDTFDDVGGRGGEGGGCAAHGENYLPNFGWMPGILLDQAHGKWSQCEHSAMIIATGKLAGVLTLSNNERLQVAI